jgi:phosphoribosylaminoimidazolecarboxamide formyltransferase/IMP cyclohydrolase
MLRAAAKNHAHVIALIDASDYEEFLRRLDADELDAEFRRRLATKAFAHTAGYDACIAGYMRAAEDGVLPEDLVVSAAKVRELRYGENPHQAAALYRLPGGGGLPDAAVLNGKPLSFNNLGDAAGAYATVSAFDEPTAVVVKHANPCGAASDPSLLTAFRRAWDGDPVSAFGGILAFNAPLTADVAEAIAEPGRFVEVIIAPEFEEDALEILRKKPKWGKNVRILACPAFPEGELDVRTIPGGYLVQERDRRTEMPADLKTVTKRAPTENEVADLVFAQRICKHVKSNAIVLARERMLVGVGAGQMSRVDSSRMAVQKAGDKARGAVFASDAFLPFSDALEVALDAGAVAAIQPGGSRNDEKCIQFADERGIAMVFTGTRHFLH